MLRTVHHEGKGAHGKRAVTGRPGTPSLHTGGSRAGPAFLVPKASPAGSMRWILQTFRKHSPL